MFFQGIKWKIIFRQKALNEILNLKKIFSPAYLKNGDFVLLNSPAMVKITTAKKKILIIRLSSIGDIILTSPVLRCLNEQLDVEIHFLTKPAYLSLLSSNPHVHSVHTLDKSLQKTVQKLQEEKFDLIIDLHHNMRTFFLKKKLGIKSFSFPKLNIQKWLMVNLKINVLPPIHIVDRYLEAVASLGVKNDGKGLDYFIPEQDKVNITSILPESFHKGYIAFAIGAQHFSKRLPLNKIISICAGTTLPVILLGGKEDHTSAEEVVKVLGNKVFNACGQFNLHQSASLAQQSEKVISHDTGLMHIAAAFNKEIISVWGNTIPEFGMYPYKVSKSHLMEVKPLSCRPCSKIGYNNCPKGHFKCMNEQDESLIINLLNNNTL